MPRRGWWPLVLALWLAGCASAPAPDAFVTGSAIARQRQYVPPDAEFDAVLLDTTDQGQPPLVLARQHIDAPGPPPYALRLPYRQADIRPHGRYEVRAQVARQGRLLLDTPAVHQVLVTPEFRHVDPVLAPVAALAATAQASVPLLQTYWLLQDMADTAPPTPPAAGAAPAHLVLHGADGRASGSGGCNRFVARYTHDGGRLRLQALSTSLRLCLDTGASEAAYLQRLQAVASFWQHGRQLELRDAQGKPLLHFVAAQRGTAPQAPQRLPTQ